MSPRRKVGASADPWFKKPDPTPRRWGLPLTALIATLLMVGAVTLSAVTFAKNESGRNQQIRGVEVLGFVRSFVTEYTSPDPFNANDYADKVLAQGTGNFAKLYSDKMNEVVIQVAQAERSFGTVREDDVGIERWNPDGSASVIAVASMTTKMPDGTKIDSSTRWEVTAVKEGDQWKVSDLIQVL